MHVTFYLKDPRPLAELASLDPDADWREFVTGERAWVLQTFLRLRARGADVSLSDRVPANGLVVFSSKQRRLLRRDCRSTQAMLIGIREDVGEALIADVEVVQNQGQSDGRRRYHVPFWPQPGLLPRDPARGDQLRTLAFKGFLGNLHPEFQSESWRQYLSSRGLQWFADAAPYQRQATDASALEWNDFRNVDLILAVRTTDPHLHARKPATKLYNAWHAGVPALLGPEIAYRELRRTDLDYIEVADPRAARAAIERLQEQPALYRGMVDNGRTRARDFTAQVIAAQWEQLLFTLAPRHLEQDGVRRWQQRSLRTKELVRRIQRAMGLWR